MLQQVKQIEEFFRNEVNEERMSRGLSAPKYDMNDSSSDVHSSKEAEMLKREVASLQKELAGLCWFVLFMFTLSTSVGLVSFMHDNKDSR